MRNGGKEGKIMFDWIKKHKIFVFIIAITVTLGVPVIIHIVFKIDSGISFLEAEWEAGDVLAYYGSILSFIGTVVLGALALYQNKLIKEESEKRADIKDKMEYEINIPRFRIDEKGYCSRGNAENLRFVINNFSGNPARYIKIYDIKITLDNKLIYEDNNDINHDNINPRESIEIQLQNPAIKTDGCIFSMKMQCYDKFSRQHNYEINGEYTKEKYYPQLGIKEV